MSILIILQSCQQFDRITGLIGFTGFLLFGWFEDRRIDRHVVFDLGDRERQS